MSMGSVVSLGCLSSLRKAEKISDMSRVHLSGWGQVCVNNQNEPVEQKESYEDGEQVIGRYLIQVPRTANKLYDLWVMKNDGGDWVVRKVVVKRCRLRRGKKEVPRHKITSQITWYLCLSCSIQTKHKRMQAANNSLYTAIFTFYRCYIANDT